MGRTAGSFQSFIFTVQQPHNRTYGWQPGCIFIPKYKLQHFVFSETKTFHDTVQHLFSSGCLFHNKQIAQRLQSAPTEPTVLFVAGVPRRNLSYHKNGMVEAPFCQEEVCAGT